VISPKWIEILSRNFDNRVPEDEGFVIWNQISEKYSNFGEIAIHKKTGQIKIVWSNLNRGCTKKIWTDSVEIFYLFIFFCERNPRSALIEINSSKSNILMLHDDYMI
jgi:hypothetical protein